jgi:hypothetical protein
MIQPMLHACQNSNNENINPPAVAYSSDVRENTRRPNNGRQFSEDQK